MTPHEIAESILGAVKWKDAEKGFCQCPGASLHTGPNKGRDCEVFLSHGRPPSIHCFHKSCEAEVAMANRSLRSAIGRAEFAQKRQNGRPLMAPSRVVLPRPEPKPAPTVPIKITQRLDLPSPMPDGARELIRAAFREGEGVRLCPATLGDNGKEMPKDSGIVLSREEWLSKLDAKNGDPNGIFRSTDRTGIYITVNPMLSGPGRDEDVTSFRHALVEFDDISPEEQYNLYRASGIPITAIISSGGKSIHAWVRVDAESRIQFDERVAAIYDHFGAYNPDIKNRNPSRFSRLPNCERFDRRQELLEIHQLPDGAFVEWQARVEADGIGRHIKPSELLGWKADAAGDCLVGNRWLCRGGSLLLVAPSGVGKSSLGLQLAIAWALGRGVWSLVPVKPLRILIVQAENNDGDLAEAMQGVVAGMGLSEFEQEELDDQIHIVTDDSRTGEAFVNGLRHLCERFKPDIAILDPLLSFIGADISRQEVCSQFLRNWLNPISSATGVAWMLIHHTGKPPTDKQAKSAWTQSDHAYAGIGSSELVNWARAVMVLRQITDGQFELKLAKRGRRAGALTKDDEPTTSLWLRHSDNIIHWEQMEAPQRAEKDPDGKPGAPSKVDQVLALGLGKIIDGLVEPIGRNALARQIEDYCASKALDITASTGRRVIERMVENRAIRKTKEGYLKA